MVWSIDYNVIEYDVTAATGLVRVADISYGVVVRRTGAAGGPVPAWRRSRSWSGPVH